MRDAGLECDGSRGVLGRLPQPRALRLITVAFVALGCYLLVQSTGVLVTGYHPHHSRLGIAWTGVTAVVMFFLAAGKAHRVLLGNPVLQTEARVTRIDAVLAMAVLLALVLNSGFGWWWADPVAGYVLVFAARV